MLHDNVLGNSDKVGPFANYLTSTIKVRHDKKMLEPDFSKKALMWITPTLEEFSEKLNALVIRSNYHDKIEEVLKTKRMPESRSKIENIGINFAWMELRIKQLEASIESIPDVIDKYRKNAKEIMKEYDIDLNINIKALSNSLIDIMNDPLYEETFNQLRERREYISSIDKVYRKMIIDLREKYNEPFDTSIETNPIFSEVNTVFNEMQVNMPELLDKSKPMMDLNFLHKHMDRVNEVVLELFHKVRDNGLSFVMADEFMNTVKNETKQKSITDFLKDKEENISLAQRSNVFDIESGKYQKLYFFKDSSIVAQKRTGEYIDVLSNVELKKIHRELIHEMIKDEFKKAPQTAKWFIQIMNEVDAIGYPAFKTAMVTYKNNSDILKLYNETIEDMYKNMEKKENPYRTMEALDDLMNKKIKFHKVKQYAHSISSNKYDHLYNDETYKIVENIYDMDLNKDIYQQNIGRKIAAYKTPEEFNSAIKSLYDSVNEFSSKATLAKANVAGIEIVVESEDLVILKIEKFEESKLMGSGSWCISRQETYFNSYTGNERDQYFIFDYTKKAEDNGSMIGITLNNGEYYTAHYKDDEQAEENDDMIQTYINTINDAYIPTYERKANQKNTLSM